MYNTCVYIYIYIYIYLYGQDTGVDQELSLGWPARRPESLIFIETKIDYGMGRGIL